MEQPQASRSAVNGALVNRLWRRAQQPGCVRLDRARALLDRHARLTGELPLADLLRRGHGTELPASGPLVLATRPALSSSPGLDARGAATVAAEPAVPVIVTVTVPLADQPPGAAEGPFPLFPAASVATPGTQTVARAAVDAVRPGAPRPDPVPAGFPVPARRAPAPSAMAAPTAAPHREIVTASPVIAVPDPGRGHPDPAPLLSGPIPLLSGPARMPADTSAPELAPVVRAAPAVSPVTPARPAPPARPASTTWIDAADASSSFVPSVSAGRRVLEPGWPRSTSERSGADGATPATPATPTTPRPPLPVVRERAAAPGAGWPGAALPWRPVVPAPGGRPRTTPDRAAEPAGQASRRADRKGDQREPARPAGPPIDLDRIVSTVQRRLTHQLAIERERRGMRR